MDKKKKKKLKERQGQRRMSSLAGIKWILGGHRRSNLDSWATVKS